MLFYSFFKQSNILLNFIVIGILRAFFIYLVGFLQALGILVVYKTAKFAYQSIYQMQQADSFPSKTTFAYHKFILTICWSILANFSIFFVMYRHRIYGYYVHMILSWLIVAFTIAMTLLFLIPIGVQVNPQDKKIQQAHNIIGLIFLISIFFQFLGGSFARIFQQNYELKSIWVLRIKKVHRIMGYLLLVIGKYQVFIGWYQYLLKEGNITFYFIVAWQAIWLIMLLIRKIAYFPSLQKNVVYHEIEEDAKIRRILDIGQIQKRTNFLIFANYVYDLTPLYNNHPGGYQVINAVKGRQVDRFLYGMYSPQKVPEIGTHSHTYRSLALLGSPIARLDIPSTFTDMRAVNICQVAYRINFNDHFYVLGLQSAQNKPFTFNGFQSLNQLGQYYAVNIGSITRLYTVVNCLRINNIETIKGLNLKNISKNQRKTEEKFMMFKNQEGRLQSEIQAVDQATTRANLINIKNRSQVTIMFKRYEKGRFTPILSQIKQKQLITISRQRGTGMRLDKIQSGTLIFLAGGTGLCPFMDLIDLLFKAEFIEHDPQNKSKFQSANPILAHSRSFNNLNFIFLIAINDMKDIHPLTLFQLHYLASQKQTFRCMMKIKNSSMIRQDYPAFIFIEQRFDKLLKSLKTQNQHIKYFICGPPVMNSALLQFMQSQQIAQQDYMMM